MSLDGTRPTLLASLARGAHLSADRESSPVSPGDRIADRYVVEEEVGHGGMATVYRARDTRHDAMVALKFLRPELAAVIGAARFAREIRITAQLQHPGIVSVFDSGEHQQIPFYVMPFIAGESLAARLKREGVLGVEEAVRMTCDVAKALAHAHAKGIVHRDVKPANILLSGPHVLLADFGVARAVSLSGTEAITDSGIALGTAQYMSPEQAVGVSIDARSDIYSLGCVLYELLAGAPPFTGPPQVVVARHSIEAAPSLQAFRRGIPTGVATAIGKAMAKVPGDRYQTVEAFATALEAGLADPSSDAPRAAGLTKRVIAGIALAGTVAAALFLYSRDPRPTLDPHRVIVFPLVVPADFPGAKSAGEDAATIIGGALDGTEPLRWIDGWSLLSPVQRDEMRAVPLADLLRIAAARGGAWAVTGRLLARGDSVTVALDLHDVRVGALAAEQSGVSGAGEPWRAALKAIGGLLPTLIPEGARQLSDDWFDRPPAAIASFLLGEAAFRRVQPDEAYAQFARALRSDSTFVAAALRGAQAASWRHRPSDASALLDRVAALPMPARHAAFVRGFRWYIVGAADSAIAAFKLAIALDPGMAEAWAQLGETYTHLLPATGNTDSAAAIALTEAVRLDSSSNGPLLHLIEQRMRGRGAGDAEALTARFLAGGPDTLLAAQVRTMRRCPARRGSEVEWSAEASRSPLALLLAANLLAGGGARMDCAEGAYRALLRADTAGNDEADNRRFYAMLALQSVLIATGRADEAIVVLDSFIARWGVGTSVFLLASPYDSAFVPRARAVAAADAERAAPSYGGIESDSRLWQLGVFDATHGSGVSAIAIARELRRRAEGESGREAAKLALSIEARLTLATGDTTRAMEMLRALVPATAPGATLQWVTAAPMAGERLLYARLQAARGDHEGAIETADVLDSPWPVVHLLTLRESLRLRATSAQAMGARGASDRYRARLAALDRSPTPAGP